MIVVLAGGLGAARFLRGLVRVVPAQEVVVVGNTGDDIDIYGVHVSPDLDIVTFMLAGVLDEARQFGITGDTRALMGELAAMGHETWFGLGDRDFAVCAARTLWLRQGVPLHEATRRIARRFRLGIELLPMTDDPVQTRVTVRESDGTAADLHFQEYWVRRRAADPVVGVRLEGAESALPAPGVLDAIVRADAILVAPSNPIVSIGTILAIPGIRDALRGARAPVTAISPIIGGGVVRGMADKLMPAAGVEVSATGVASLYSDFIDAFVVDYRDEESIPAISGLGVRAVATQALMHAPDDAAALAKVALEAAT